MNGITAQELEKKMTAMLKKHGVNSLELKTMIANVRKNLDLSHKITPQKIPTLPTMKEVKNLFNVIVEGENVLHYMFFRLLAFTGLRISEARDLQFRDLDFTTLQITVVNGKGGKKRIVPIHKSIKSELIHFVSNARKTNKLFIFETNYAGKRQQITSKALQSALKRYVKTAKIENDFTPHTFRHLMITEMTKNNMSSASMQKITGHASQNNLEIYQNMHVEDVKDDFNESLFNLDQ